MGDYAQITAFWIPLTENNTCLKWIWKGIISFEVSITLSVGNSTWNNTEWNTNENKKHFLC